MKTYYALLSDISNEIRQYYILMNIYIYALQMGIKTIMYYKVHNTYTYIYIFIAQELNQIDQLNGSTNQNH